MVQPLAIPTLPGAVAAVAGDDRTNLRQGRITAIQAGKVTVEIDGTVVTTEAVHLRRYMPVLGDYVQIAWQGPSLLILGALSGQPPDNTVPNWSFEDAGTGSSGDPDLWGSWVVAGTSTVETALLPDGMETVGRFAGKITITSVGGTARLVSSPVPVDLGQVWSAGALVSVAGNGADTVAAEMFVGWYPDAASGTAGYVRLDTVCSHTFIGRSPDWYQMRGGGGSASITAPAGATVARVIVGIATAAAGSAAYFDEVTFRRIT